MVETKTFISFDALAARADDKSKKRSSTVKANSRKEPKQTEPRQKESADE